MTEKALPRIQPIIELFSQKGDLVYPLSQHIGAPANPIVAVGDQCPEGSEDRRGRRICICAGLCICVRYSKGNRAHSFNATGSKVNCIVVENDGTI